MKHQLQKRRSRAFSLVEMLVVIAVIGIISAIAVPTIGSITSTSELNKSKRNAQNFVQLYQSARAVGTTFTSDTKRGIFDELVVGKTGPDLAGSQFKLSDLQDEDKTAALTFVAYDSSVEEMVYSPGGGETEAAVAVDGFWGDWTPTGSSGIVPNGTSATEPIAQNKAGEASAAFPETTFFVQYYYANWQVFYINP